MAIAVDGSFAPDELPKMNCGGVPIFDNASGCAYRCDKCMAIIGSISQPDDCKEINMQYADDE